MLPWNAGLLALEGGEVTKISCKKEQESVAWVGQRLGLLVCAQEGAAERLVTLKDFSR